MVGHLRVAVRVAAARDEHTHGVLQPLGRAGAVERVVEFGQRIDAVQMRRHEEQFLGGRDVGRGRVGGVGVTRAAEERRHRDAR